MKNAFAKLALSLGLISAIGVTGFTNSAEAAPSGDPAGWVGAIGGLTVPNASNTSARGLYGITAGAKLGREYGLGAYYLTSSKDEDVASMKVPFNYDLYGVEFAYHFEGEAAGVYVGGRVGTSKIKVGAASNSAMNYGAVAGFNHMLGSAFSVGGELSWMGVQQAGSAPDDSPAFSMLNFLATVKFWF